MFLSTGLLYNQSFQCLWIWDKAKTVHVNHQFWPMYALVAGQHFLNFKKYFVFATLTSSLKHSYLIYYRALVILFKHFAFSSWWTWILSKSLWSLHVRESLFELCTQKYSSFVQVQVLCPCVCLCVLFYESFSRRWCVLGIIPCQI